LSERMSTPVKCREPSISEINIRRSYSQKQHHAIVLYYQVYLRCQW